MKYGSHFISYDQYNKKMHTSFKFHISQEKFKMKLLQYDTAMNLVKENELAGGDKVFGPFDAVLRIINNKLYLLYFEMGKSEDSPIKLMAGEIDTLKNDFSSTKELMVIENKEASFLKAADVLFNYKLIIKSSLDESKTLLAWTAGTSSDYFYAVIDANLNPVWSKRGSLQIDDKVELVSCCLDASDNIYLGLRAFTKKVGYSGHIIVGHKTGKDSDITLSPTNGRIYETHVVYNEILKQVQILGTYKTEDFEHTLLGVFSASMNTGFKVSNLQQIPFSEDLLQQLSQTGWASTKAKSRGTLFINLIAGQLENGAIDLVGEFRRVEEGVKTSFILSGDIMIVRFNNGTFRFHRIPKIRVSSTRLIGDSYSAFINGKNTIIFYNDKSSNLLKDMTASPDRSDNYKNVVMVAATVSDDQPMKREKVIDLQDENYLSVTDLITVITPEAFFVPIQKVKGLGGLANESRWATLRIELPR